MVLPSNPRQEPLWPRPYRQLPRLIQHKQTNSKRDRQEPVLDWNRRRIDSALHGGRVAEDEDDDNGEDHGGEEEQVLRVFIEDGRLLEDAEAAGARREEVEELPGKRVSKR